MLKRLYLLGAILGVVLPYSYFGSFVIDHGLDISLDIVSLSRAKFEEPARPRAARFAVGP